MKLFKSESLYDAETQQWVEKFWVNDELVDEDVYYFYLEREKEAEDKKLEEENEVEINECDDCRDCCDCEDCCKEVDGISYDELLDIFVCKIINTEGCPGCIRDVLDQFAEVLLDEEE